MENPDSYHSPSIYFLVQSHCMYNGFRIFHLHHCGGKTLPTGMQCLYTYFPLILQMLLISSYWGQYVPLTPFTEVVSYTCRIDSFVITCMPSWDPLSSRWIFKFAYVKVHALYVMWSFMSLDKCTVSCSHHYNIIQNIFPP